MTTDILIVDDDSDLSQITSDILQEYGYQTKCCISAEEAYDFLKANTPLLIILDINLPGEDGYAFCQSLRRESEIPIIFISARSSERDRINGLELGGDDYLTKPYSLQELLSRVKAMLRRTYGFGNQGKVYTFSDVSVDIAARSVKKCGKEVSLSLREFDLLKYMLEHSSEVLKKEEVFAKVWGVYSEVEISSLAVHIRWLREKLEDDPSHPKHILTVWGVGYRFEL